MRYTRHVDRVLRAERDFKCSSPRTSKVLPYENNIMPQLKGEHPFELRAWQMYSTHYDAIGIRLMALRSKALPLTGCCL